MIKLSNIKKKALGSLGSLIIIGLMVITPGIIAGNLEKIETSSDEILSREEVHQLNNSVYRPYLDLNQDSLMKGPSDIDTDGIFYYGSGSWLYIDDDIIWDTDGYLDFIPLDDTRSSLYIYFWGDAEALINGGLNHLRLEMNSEIPYSLNRIEWVGWDIGWERTGYEGFWGFDTDQYTGSNVYDFNIDSSFMNDGASVQSDALHRGIMIRFDFENPSSSNLIYFTLQWEPEYYQDDGQTQTVTVYEPYLLEISNPYLWHKWILGFGGLLLLVVSVIISPLVNPRSWISKRR